MEKTQSLTSDEWYTPKHIVEALGEFDLDPCSPVNRLWDTAKKHLTKDDNGLLYNWQGQRVWLNPPYSKPLLTQFIEKMVEHNNGILLLFNKCDSKIFYDLILTHASGIRFLKKRIKFYYPNGLQGKSPTCGNILISFNDYNASILEKTNLDGKFIKIN